MQRDNLPRSGRFARAVAVGASVAIAFFMFTGSPVWVFVSLILLVVMAIVMPTEEIRHNLAWRDRSVPLPLWPYWLASGIGYLAFLGMIAALLLRARDVGVLCAVTFILSTLARIVLRSAQIHRSLHLPRRPAPSPPYRRIEVGSLVGYAVMILAILLGQNVLALVVGVSWLMRCGLAGPGGRLPDRSGLGQIPPRPTLVGGGAPEARSRVMKRTCFVDGLRRQTVERLRSP